MTRCLPGGGHPEQSHQGQQGMCHLSRDPTPTPRQNCYLVSRLLICLQFLVAKGNRSGAVIISHSHPILPEGQGCQYLTVHQEKAPHRVIQATGDKLRL